ncbi:MAG: hypothetical protein AAFR87_33085, partial [Bacteroidota bacterium]
MRHYYLRLIRWIREKQESIQPGKRAFMGAQKGLLYSSLTLFVISGFLTTLSSNDWRIILFLILFIASSILGGMLLSSLSKKLSKLPEKYHWTLFASVPLLLIAGGFSEKHLIYMILMASLLGASIAVLSSKTFKTKPRAHKITTFLGLGLGSSMLIAAILYFAPRGFDLEDPLPELSKAKWSHPVLADPSERGGYTVREFFYGSGKDKHRKGFGPDADYISPTVDGTAFLDEWEGFAGWYRTWYWGHDYRKLPLNAQVWYPEGEGPFPLVLITHGNHGMQDYSDVGYGYLGEMLASRGYIFATVDENFLNGSWSDIFGGLEKENDARAWILLEHLKLWHQWNEEAEHPFFGKLDTANIALIGHSRGGEAMSHAAAFNQLSAYPDDGSVKFDYDFNIKAVCAIAPVDGQYQPGRTRTYFNNVNYFSLHGAQDADVTSFAGSRIYERINYTDSLYHFKAGLYIYGANHGQFNTSWGDNDRGGVSFTRLLNLKQLMPATDQEQIAKVYISAFLDASLKGKTEYLPLFTDARIGADFLPENVYLNQFEDTEMQFLSKFDEDLDLLSSPYNLNAFSASNVTVWKEANVKMKYGVKETRAVYLGWHRDEDQTDTAFFHMDLKGSEIHVDSSSQLVFSMSHVKGSTNPKSKGKWVKDEENNESEKDKEEDDENETDEGENEDEEEKKAEGIDLTIQLKDEKGAVLEFPLSDFSPL